MFVIHAGMHKTGTTSLQNLLSEEREYLASRGIVYPLSETEHHGQYINLLSEDWTPGWCEEQVGLARQRGVSAILLSGEVVSSHSFARQQRLAACFRECDLRFVICFRHWNSYLPSRWAQYCARRDSQTFAEYLAMIGASTSHIDRRFDLVLKNALGAGAVSAISYDWAVEADGSVVPTMLRAIGVDDVLACRAAERPNFNVRGDWRRIELTRILNGIVADERKLPQNELSLAVGHGRACCNFFDLGGRISVLDPDLVSEIYSILESRKAAPVLKPNLALDEVESVLQEQFAGSFVNLNEGRIFPSSAPLNITTTDLTWSEFRSLHPKLVDLALAGIRFKS